MEREGGHGNVDTGTGYLIEELSDRVSGTAYGWGLDRSGGTEESDVYQRTYLWNEENRLIQSQDNNLTVQYRYNADGQRSHKYSDRGESLYFDSLYSSASTGDIDRMRDSIHIYLGQTRIATRLKMDDSSDYEYSRLNTYYYHSDHLGSAQLVTDYAGEEYEHMEYTPYGELWLERNRDGSDLIPFRFTGKEFDTETNLYYYGARYMDPRTSRWISSDPAGAMLASPNREGFSLIEATNHYSYVSNNPINYTDPTGMQEDPVEPILSEQNRILESGTFLPDPDQFQNPTYMYLYSGDTMGEGQSWEYTFQEAAYAQAVADGVAHYDANSGNIVANEGFNVLFQEVNNRNEFESAIEGVGGNIARLTVASHMYDRGLNLDYESSSAQRLVRATDVDNINAMISGINLLGCNPGASLPAGQNNIAQSFANRFGAPTTGANSGTWINGVVRDSSGNRIPSTIAGRTLIQLVPNGGSWQTFRP
jgi:RHS repeat-associated protein